jgi:hypothetical protein
LENLRPSSNSAGDPIDDFDISLLNKIGLEQHSV